MAKQFKIAAAVLGLAASLAGGSAFAQQAGAGMQGGGAQGGVQQQGGMQGGGMQGGGMQGGGMQGMQGGGMQGGGFQGGMQQGGGFQGGMQQGGGFQGGGAQGIGGGGQQQIAPQYWLADASIFIRNASNTARTMAKEQTLNVQAPQIVGSQGQFLMGASQRAQSDLNNLLQNASATNPQAVPQIRQAMAELGAAQVQAQQVVQAAQQGALGPQYKVSLDAAVRHLQTAERHLAGISRAYGPGFGAGLGIGGAQGGAQQGGGAQGGQQQQQQGGGSGK